MMGHTKNVSMTNSRSSNNPSTYSKVTSFTFEDAEKTILPDTEAVTAIYFLDFIHHPLFFNHNVSRDGSSLIIR
jgi:hypothetical protein